MGALLGLLGLAALGVSLVGLVRGHGWLGASTQPQSGRGGCGWVAGRARRRRGPDPVPVSVGDQLELVGSIPVRYRYADLCLAKPDAHLDSDPHSADHPCPGRQRDAGPNADAGQRAGLSRGRGFARPNTRPPSRTSARTSAAECSRPTRSSLWPQPRTGTGNAAVKNGLESHLRDLVCAGAVPLAEAQHTMASDWSAANARYAAIPVPPPPAAVTPPPPHADRANAGRHLRRAGRL
jgi:hypothetical protein